MYSLVCVDDEYEVVSSSVVIDYLLLQCHGADGSVFIVVMVDASHYQISPTLIMRGAMPQQSWMLAAISLNVPLELIACRWRQISSFVTVLLLI